MEHCVTKIRINKESASAGNWHKAASSPPLLRMWGGGVVEEKIVSYRKGGYVNETERYD